MTVDSDGDGTTIRGKGTHWKRDIKSRNQIMLGKEYGFATVEVAEVVDDTTAKLKKPFAESVVEQAKSAKDGLKYKILPYIDQTKVRSPI